MKVALVYDRVNKWGGAERVLLALRDLFPDAPLFTSVYNPSSAPWAKGFKVISSPAQRLPLAPTSHELYPYLMPLAFESFDFDGFDLVISVTSEAAKGIITKPKTLHICYCLTPTRYLWSGYGDYFQNPLFRVLVAPVVSYLRKWDLIASTRPDHMIAISEEVQKRIRRYYGREAPIIYPPAQLENREGYQTDRDEYFLVVSRLSRQTPYKRVELAIDVATQMHLPLRVVGDGNLKAALRMRAGPSVIFLGSVSDRELARQYAGARALIFPGKEDFGLVMVEAQKFGIPVIAYDRGGATEIITHGKTGVLFPSQSRKGLKEAIEQFKTMQFKAADLRKNAKRFDLTTFQKQFLAFIEQSV